MRPGYPMIYAMVLVVTSFAVSLAYSQWMVRQIDDRALSIIEDSIPRFRHISEARRALLETAILTDECIASGKPADNEACAQIPDVFRQIQAELDAYDPAAPQEAAAIAAIKQASKELEVATQQAVEGLDQGDRAAALAEFVRQTRPFDQRIIRAIEQVRQTNLDRVARDSEHILTVRRRAVLAATFLGLLSLALAIAATALVVYGQRGRARVTAERDRLLTERAAELDLFAGRVAHDLRDPLHAASLRLTVLSKNRELDESVRGQLAKVSVQLGRMRGVIDGLLDFARAGARPADGAHASLPVVLDEVLSSLSPAAEAAHTELRVGPIPDAPLAVAPAALGSVLSNLVGNAVKYVGEGEQLPHRVVVRASRRPGLTRIEVEDNGPGLPEGAEQRVFEPFRRFPSQQQGTGLGLATVKRIVEAYQGRVGVVARPGLGSTFWVELPCSDAQPASPRRAPVHER